MSKLWIFGDSYGVPLSTTIDWFWADQVREHLGCDKSENRCILGASNEAIQYCIMKESSNIRSEDYVIVISTSIDRKWFFKDLPYAGNFFCSNLEELVGRNSANAVKQYILYLMNPDMIYINFHQFLGWVHYVTDKNKWNLIVIPGFEEHNYPVSHRYTVTGSLYNACVAEFCTQEDNLWYYKDFCNGRDRRSGHLTKNNHKILAEKISETFKYSSPLDLTNGLLSNIISKNNINSIMDQFVEIK